MLDAENLTFIVFPPSRNLLIYLPNPAPSVLPASTDRGGAKQLLKTCHLTPDTRPATILLCASSVGRRRFIFSSPWAFAWRRWRSRSAAAGSSSTGAQASGFFLGS